MGSIHSSPPGRQTRVGARWLGSGRRERRKRRSASTAVLRRKRAAREARASMMGTQGPQGSGGHEAGSDAGGPSMYPEGCSGVKGIWRDRSEEEAQSREGERQRVPRQEEKRDGDQGAEYRPQKHPGRGRDRGDPERARGVRWWTGGSLRGLQPGRTAQNSQPPPRGPVFLPDPRVPQSSKCPKGVFPPVFWAHQILLGLERKQWVLSPGIPTCGALLLASPQALFGPAPLTPQSSSSLCLREAAGQLPQMKAEGRAPLVAGQLHTKSPA